MVHVIWYLLGFCEVHALRRKFAVTSFLRHFEATVSVLNICETLKSNLILSEVKITASVETMRD